jgi:hypothetical protein
VLRSVDRQRLRLPIADSPTIQTLFHRKMDSSGSDQLRLTVFSLLRPTSIIPKPWFLSCFCRNYYIEAREAGEKEWSFILVYLCLHDSLPCLALAIVLPPELRKRGQGGRLIVTLVVCQLLSLPEGLGKSRRVRQSQTCFIHCYSGS